MNAQQLQQLLDAVGQSQVGAARELGISPRNMRRYVKGALPIPLKVQLAVRCLYELPPLAASSASNREARARKATAHAPTSSSVIKS